MFAIHPPWNLVGAFSVVIILIIVSFEKSLRKCDDEYLCWWVKRMVGQAFVCPHILLQLSGANFSHSSYVTSTFSRVVRS